MFDYMTAQEAALKWSISLCWVERICKEICIEGFINVNRIWLVSNKVEKPAAARKR